MAIIETDETRLKSLGYKPQFQRVLGLFGDFALGYSYMSPVAGFYALFAFALTAAGPAFFWTMPIALFGQLLGALILAEAASEFPIAGGVYQWARRLGGSSWGFLTAWLYLLALLGTIAGLAAGVAPFISGLLGVTPNPVFNASCGIILVLLSGVLNLFGTRWVGRSAEVGVWAGLIGLLAFGVYLLLFGQVQPVSVLWSHVGAADSTNPYPALFAASLIGIWIFFGHEACGDLAEEVQDASTKVPRAMMLTMIAGGSSALIIALGMILAIPNMADAMAGKVNPGEAIANAAFGATGGKIMLLLMVVVVFSATVSIIASASRLLFSMGRDRVLFGSAALSRINPERGLPVPAVIVATIVPCLMLGVGILSADAATAIISFATAGVYTSFLMVALAAFSARMGGWVPSGPFRMGAAGWLINLLAIVYGVVAILNIMWPRPASPTEPLWWTFLIPLSLIAILVVGVLQLGNVRALNNAQQPAE
jgi:amino acid transporter